MIYKRGRIYWYKFVWQGESIRESTKQGNDKVARQMEAAHRTSLAKGEVGIRERKQVPTLGTFAGSQFMPWAQATFAAKPKTWLWYRNGVRRLLAGREVAECNLDQIAGEHIAGYVARRQSEGLLVSSINRELQVLRGMLRLALEWGVVERVAKVRMISGEQHREFVLTSEEEARYLAAAPEPLASIATVLADTGFRPEESYRMRWEAVTWMNGRNGTILVTHGKTAAARRVIPMTPRVRALLEMRWEASWAARGGLGVDCTYPQWPRRSVEPQEAAREGSQVLEGAALCAVFVPPHVSDAPRRVRLRCLDAGADRWAQFHRNLSPVCPPVRGCRAHRHFAAGWAQFWAQCDFAR